MEKIFTRYVVTAVLAAWTSACFADFEANFNSLESQVVADLSEEGWILTNCNGAFHGEGSSNSDRALYFALSGSSAVTPAIGKNCNAHLIFSYANSAINKKSTFRVTISGGGHFGNNVVVKNYYIDTNFKTYFTENLDIYNANAETKLVFELTSTNYFVIDNVKLTTSTPITISESATATSFTQQLADVTVGRTLMAEVWSTLCLPFDVTKKMMEAAMGGETVVKMCTLSNYANGTMTFTKTDAVEAGKPFLIKVSANVTNPKFLLVDVKNTAAGVVTVGDVSMVGCYGQTALTAGNGQQAVFLTAAGELKRPGTTSNVMNGLRAYFRVPSNFAGARVVIVDEETTGIDALPMNVAPNEDAVYNLAGQKLSQPTVPGIYINNGKKVIIK